MFTVKSFKEKEAGERKEDNIRNYWRMRTKLFLRMAERIFRRHDNQRQKTAGNKNGENGKIKHASFLPKRETLCLTRAAILQKILKQEIGRKKKRKTGSKEEKC